MEKGRARFRLRPTFSPFIAACVVAVSANMCPTVLDSSHKGLVCSYSIPEGECGRGLATLPLSHVRPCPAPCLWTRLPFLLKIEGGERERDTEGERNNKSRKERKVDVG